MMKRILIIGGWIIGSGALVFMTGFAMNRHENRSAAGVDITIERNGDQYFVSEDNIRTMLIRNGFDFDNQKIGEVSVPVIEQLVANDPGVEMCDVSISVNGKVHITIVQRRAVARITNLAGDSYYMDDKGRLMPVNSGYTAPVIVVNGWLADSYSEWSDADFSTVGEDSALATTTHLDDIWNIIHAVEQDSFLGAQMVQLYLSPEEGYVFIPRVGDHRIIFGDASGIDGKFKKLHLFYAYGLAKTGRWDEYSAIDLRFKNQIVCTKKPIANGI